MNENINLLYGELVRLKNFPLDKTNQHKTYRDMVNYINNSRVSYDGQLLTVYDDENKFNNAVYFVTPGTKNFIKVPNTEEVANMISEATSSLVASDTITNIQDRLTNLETQGINTDLIEQRILNNISKNYATLSLLEEKVKQIIYNGDFEQLPSNLDTLKELSDWISLHETELDSIESVVNSFSRYGTEIQTQKSDIAIIKSKLTDINDDLSNHNERLREIEANYVSKDELKNTFEKGVEKVIKTTFNGNITDYFSSEEYIPAQSSISSISIKLENPDQDSEAETDAQTFEVGLASLETYSITFVNNGHGETPRNVLSATQILRFPKLTDAEYLLVGWFEDEAFSIPAKLGPITKNMVYYAKWEPKGSSIRISNDIPVLSGSKESININFKIPAGYEDYIPVVEYSLDGRNYTTVDEELGIKTESSEGTTFASTIVGLLPGVYNVRITLYDMTISGVILVEPNKREGYAFFKYNDGVGAYKNDGSLKDNAIVVYVNDENKNSFEYEFEDGVVSVGLKQFIETAKTYNKPVSIRISGEVTTNQWRYREKEESLAIVNDVYNSFIDGDIIEENQIIAYGINTKETSKTDINGLRSYIERKASVDSANDCEQMLNILEIKGFNNLTIEGVTKDAKISNFGFSFKECNSIEVKNLTFENYPNDAIEFVGGNSDTYQNYGHYWVHTCKFNRGHSNWDITAKKDKGNGDGSIDSKYCQYVTISDCKFERTDKTMLIGGCGSDMQDYFTISNCLFDTCKSRLPYVAKARTHIYNCIFKNNGEYCIKVRYDAKVFAENNYFVNWTKAVTYPDPEKDSSAFGYKFYNNLYESPKEGPGAGSIRLEAYNGVVFDTDSNKFYFDNEHSKSDVELIAPAILKKEMNEGSLSFGIPFYKEQAGSSVGIVYTDKDEDLSDDDAETNEYIDESQISSLNIKPLIDSNNIDLNSDGNFVYVINEESGATVSKLYIKVPQGIKGSVYLKYSK